MRLQVMTRILAGATIVAALGGSSWVAAQGGASTVLKPSDLEKLFPATVYYCGQTAPAQVRNSGGVKFGDGHYVLASLVDTSGYSSGVAAKYQGYLIAEVPIRIGGKNLAVGAYGFGFLDDGRFVTTDLGGKDVLAVHSAKDSAMTRPRPLEVMDDPSGGFRLYSGRSYVHFDR
jgi:hypothetical protein